jgi:hypothetical protein
VRERERRESHGNINYMTFNSGISSSSLKIFLARERERESE